MNNSLESYLRTVVSEPFIWGQTDCCVFLAEWILWKHAVDLASGFLSLYSSQRGAQRLIKQEGGLLAILDKSLLPAGFPRTKAPMEGDAGLVETQLGETAAIRTQTGWVCKSPGGLIAAAFPVIASWKL